MPWILPRHRQHVLVRHVLGVVTLYLLSISAGVAFGRTTEPPHVTQQQDEPVKQPEQESDSDKPDLGERLIREAAGGGPEDIMAQIVRLMNESQRQLEIKYDAGEETLAVQDQILARLQEAIDQAAAQLRRKSGKPKPQQGDKRRRPQDRNNPGQKGQEGQQGAKAKTAAQPGQQASNAVPAGGKVTEGAGGTGEAFRESRRAWGLLPQRDREEIIQGMREDVLDRYRDWINDYFRALQGGEQSSTGDSATGDASTGESTEHESASPGGGDTP